MDLDSTPTLSVTVVIPILNAEQKVDPCLQAVLGQNYPMDQVEVIAVDNGSSDRSVERIKKYPVKLLHEHSKKSPYAARNLGIEEGSGEVIALLDINCIPDPYWLSYGVKYLIEEEADLVGGEVNFILNPKDDVSQMYDSITNVNMKRNIETRGVAKGGNLFIRRYVFEQIGLFPNNNRSGEDVLWTRMATQNGFKLIYGEHCTVDYDARGLIPLLKKQFRVGIGKGRMLAEKFKFFHAAKEILKGFRPLSRKDIRELIEERGTKEYHQYLPKLRVVSFLTRSATSLGRIYFLMTYPFRKLLNLN